MFDENDLVDEFDEEEDLIITKRSGVPLVSRISIIEELTALTLVKPRQPKAVKLGVPGKAVSIDLDSDTSITPEDINLIMAKLIAQG